VVKVDERVAGKCKEEKNEMVSEIYFTFRRAIYGRLLEPARPRWSILEMNTDLYTECMLDMTGC